MFFILFIMQWKHIFCYKSFNICQREYFIHFIHWMILICVAFRCAKIELTLTEHLRLWWIVSSDTQYDSHDCLRVCFKMFVLFIVWCRVFHFNELMDIDSNLRRVKNIFARVQRKVEQVYGFVLISKLQCIPKWFCLRIRSNLPIGPFCAKEGEKKKDSTLNFISYIEFA